MNRKMKVMSMVTAFVLVVGGGLSVLAASRGIVHPAKTNLTPQLPNRTSSAPHLLSLTQRERTLSSKQAGQYHAIPILTSKGTHTTLDVFKQPIVFVSDWDTTILNQFAGQKFKNEPTLVVTWPSTKETLQQELAKVMSDAKQLHLTNPIVALNSAKPMQWITGVPDTYMVVKGHVMEIPGPLPANEVQAWSKVFN